MKNRVVIKFGGASLSNGKKIREAAEKIINLPYEEIVIVVSAMGDTTNKLIETISEIGKIDDEDYAEIVSMGERISARFFSSALNFLGKKSIFLEPSQDNWPIITDSNFKNANIDIEKTKILIKKYLEPILGSAIPVICGFLGKDINGNITTLGRGGSDITALVLGNCLEANEVILVKDTEGVFSTDPKILPNARPIDKIDIHEFFSLAHGGAKIIRAEALKYKLPNQKIRIVSSSSNDFSKGGTEIIGVFNPDSFEIIMNKKLIAINIICEINSENLCKIFSILNENPIHGISTGKNSITIFTEINDLNKKIKELHDFSPFKAISYKEKIGMIQIINPIFIESPGWVARIAEALASKNINIIEVTTSKAAINVFIDEDKIEEAIELIKKSLISNKKRDKNVS
ncbi:MAG: aspartate kinase [Candidatus Aenigmatarchaeota archaeon]